MAILKNNSENIVLAMDNLEDLKLAIVYAVAYLKSEIEKKFIDDPDNSTMMDRNEIWCDFERILELESKMNKYHFC